MDDLLQQESLVESQIETYQAQLALVEQQLDVAGGENTPDLQQLHGSLSELIALTKESLLEIKKQRLLLTLQDPGTTPNSQEPAPKSPPSCGSGSGRGGAEGLTGEGEGVGEEGDELQGLFCQAPLKEAWDAVNFHNAVIIGRERERMEAKEEEDVKVGVLFTHPTYDAMKPCPYFLNGDCKFSDQICKFSHGHTVSLSELRPFQEPDFRRKMLSQALRRTLASRLNQEEEVFSMPNCVLVRTPLFMAVCLSSIGDTFTVHFTTLNATVQLEPEGILPLESSDESSSDSSSSEEEEGKGEEEEVRVVEWRPTGPDFALGDWEKYTTGIGSKLLTKMGYVVGKGLGKHDQGRVEPVEIVVLPVGKSLDKCAELREAKKLRKPVGQEAGRRRRRRRGKGKGTGSLEPIHQQQGEEKVIFDFLNKKLLGKDSRFPEGSGSGEGLRKADGGGARTSHSNGKEKESLNIKLFKVQEEMMALQKRRRSLQQTLRRHKGRNNAMEAHTQEKLADAARRLAQLQRHEQTIQKSITSKSEQRKLSVF